MSLKKNSDIAEEATKANNGNIHPGVLAKPGTLKAKLNLEGNKLYTKLSEELNFELKRPGSLNVVYDEKEWKKNAHAQVPKKNRHWLSDKTTTTAYESSWAEMAKWRRSSQIRA